MPLVLMSVRNLLLLAPPLESNPDTIQLGIQFVQIGKDSGAKEFLQDLDDNLKGSEPDQVERVSLPSQPHVSRETI